MAGINFKKIPFLVMNKIGIEHIDSCDDSKSKGKENSSSSVKKFGSEFGNVNTAKACLSLPVADSNSARYRDVERNGMKNVNGGRAFFAGGDIVFQPPYVFHSLPKIMIVLRDHVVMMQ